MYDSPEVDASRRLGLILSYRHGVDTVLVALEHLSEDDLSLRPTPEHWSARELAHHLADAELQDSVQLRRMLSENTPLLHHWDEMRYAERLHYDRPAGASIAAFRALAMLNMELLEALSDSQWRREGNEQHPWLTSVEGWLEDKVKRLNGRLMQILNAPTGGRVIEDHPDFFQSLLDRFHKLSHP